MSFTIIAFSVCFLFDTFETSTLWVSRYFLHSIIEVKKNFTLFIQAELAITGHFDWYMSGLLSPIYKDIIWWQVVQ